MTITDDPRSPKPEPGTGDDMDGPCQACGHQRLSHDTTATRFCRATLDHARDRACVCNPPEPAKPSATPMYGRGRFSGR